MSSFGARHLLKILVFPWAEFFYSHFMAFLWPFNLNLAN